HRSDPRAGSPARAGAEGLAPPQRADPRRRAGADHRTVDGRCDADTGGAGSEAGVLVRLLPRGEAAGGGAAVMNDQRIPLATAQRLIAGVYERLKPTCDQIEIAGSIRRRSSDVKDGEIVAIPT